MEYLNQELIKRTRKNPGFSQRAFAKFLDLSPGELSEILNGKRKLSLKKALVIAEKLSLDPQETMDFLSKVKTSAQPQKSNSKKDIRSDLLTIDAFELVSNWYCFAIINLSECVGFSWEKDYIAKKLGITHAEARDALNRLEKVGLIEKHDEDYRVVSDFVMGPDKISSTAVKRSHHDLLQKAIVALEEKTIDERNITGIGMALSESEYKAMVKDITKFRRELVKKYGYTNKKKNKVYQLEFALFELTEGSTDE
ncbi:MAG: TIGR02147 family protein [Halobacteriovoraceae bacterium]|nr:TIGR02147 family protein [Halobacteriovoraceae bacterium]